MNSKGQANSVFKILIAAVVAGAILMILMNTLNFIPSIGGEDPNSSATDRVKSSINTPGIPTFVDVTFSKDNSLNSKAIALQSKVIDKERVCVLVSESAPNYDAFEDMNNKHLVVQYTGSYSVKTRLMVMCDKGDELEFSIDDYGYGDTDSYDFDVTGCTDFDSISNKCCVVVVVGE